MTCIKLIVLMSGLTSAPSTPIRTDAPPSPFSNPSSTPTPILPIGEVLSEATPMPQPTKRKAPIKDEPVKAKKPKVEPTLKLESQAKQEDANTTAAVIVESGPVAYAPDGTVTKTRVSSIFPI